ncbi:hypothetical protein COOONC_14717, partial [Cooperia oncophora]
LTLSFHRFVPLFANISIQSKQQIIVTSNNGNTFRGRFYIQTELCGPNLQDYRAQYGPLYENEQWTVFTDMLKALERLHSMDMLHLDVKPSNIYLSLDNRSCKLGDFGLAINLEKVRQS